MARIFSGIQPTGGGVPHLDNFLGALKGYAALQDGNRAFYCVVDQHATTLPYDFRALGQASLTTAAALMACGVDAARAALFRQSAVPGHSLLAQVLGHVATLGPLERMTQFKEKGRAAAGDGRDGIGLGLLTFPVLMAADILLYDTDSVPVGEDQRQHLELTRDVAQRFNATFGETFVIPEADIQAEGARIMSLDDPTKKMSKSGAPASYIAFQDTPSEIHKKIMRAVTDSGSDVVYREDKPAISNLLTIYSLFSDEPIAAIEQRYAGSGYGQFKKDLAEVVAGHMEPIQRRLAELSADPGELLRILDRGTERARELATPKMERVREVTGIAMRQG